jgi:hypothetical protein
VAGLSQWLASKRVPLKDFTAMAEDRTKQLREALEEKATQAGRPVEYLASFTNKEALVQERRQRDGVAPSGLICAFSTLENCSSYDMYRDAKSHEIALRKRPRKCLHYYFYFEDDRFGLAQFRLQTWFPFSVNVVLNGRVWLAKQLDRAGIGYVRKDNCFTSGSPTGSRGSPGPTNSIACCDESIPPTADGSPTSPTTGLSTRASGRPTWRFGTPTRWPNCTRN